MKEVDEKKSTERKVFVQRLLSKNKVNEKTRRKIT